MEEGVAAIAHAITEEERNETTVGCATSSCKQGHAKTAPEPGIAVSRGNRRGGSTFSSSAETVKKHEPQLEDLVREALRPVLKLWPDDKLLEVVERMVPAEIERAIRGRSPNG